MTHAPDALLAPISCCVLPCNPPCGRKCRFQDSSANVHTNSSVCSLTRSSMVMDGAAADCSLVPRCESPAPMVAVAATTLGISAGECGLTMRVASVEMLG